MSGSVRGMVSSSVLLLCVSREDILAWLADQGYAYMVDSTNLSDAYTRNFIRLNVLPLLEEINPSAREYHRTFRRASFCRRDYIYMYWNKPGKRLSYRMIVFLSGR